MPVIDKSPLYKEKEQPHAWGEEIDRIAFRNGAPGGWVAYWAIGKLGCWEPGKKTSL